MPYDPGRHHRRSIRLRGYDYGQAGAYFVTVVAQHRECLFGDVVDDEMRLNGVGRAVKAAWEDLPSHYPHVELDAFVVMPNHVHGILLLHDDAAAAARPTVGAGFKPAPTDRHGLPARGDTAAGPEPAGPGAGPTAAGSESTTVGAGFKPAPTRRHGLPEIIRAFKTFSARRANQLRDASGAALWQRNYYEHVIRDERALDRIREYVVGNPAQWASDRENPSVTATTTHRRGAEPWEV